jgi:integrase
MARDKMKRNVVELTEVPAGLPGRPSKAMSAQQADDVITKTTSDRMHPYIVMSLLTGARTEELRALRWKHVLEGLSDITPPVPPFVEVWRSVRAGGDTKTMKSRRTIALPDLCVRALVTLRAQQDAERRAAGDQWHETGLVSGRGSVPRSPTSTRCGFARSGWWWVSRSTASGTSARRVSWQRRRASSWPCSPGWRPSGAPIRGTTWSPGWLPPKGTMSW